MPLESISGGSVTCEVLLCTYNGERFLGEQLWSIAQQSRRVDLISIRDDRSTDGTVALAQSLGRQIENARGIAVRIAVNAERLGYAGNFSRAIESSTGDLLFLCDQDDVWEPRKVERIVQCFVERGAEMVFSDGSVVDAGGGGIAKTSVLNAYGLSARDMKSFSRAPLEYLTRRNYVNGAAAAVSRRAALEALPVPPSVPHDYWLALWCAYHDRLFLLDERLYRYRQHEANVIGLASGSWMSALRSAWRNPVEPRRREYSNWVEICRRLMNSAGASTSESVLRGKLQWMHARFKVETAVSLAAWVVGSAIRGDYRRYSVRTSLFRDVAAVLSASSNEQRDRPKKSFRKSER